MHVLAIGCHPDDLEIACFGTLKRCIQRGDTVTICHVANGCRGHVIIDPVTLREMRREEARASGESIGASKVVTMDVPDLELDSNDRGLITAMTELIRQEKPDFIITHSPHDYMRDHLEVQKLVFDASFSASLWDHSNRDAGVAAITPLFYMDTLAGVNFLPTEYVDISDVIEDKIAALDCHQTQIAWMRDHDKIDFLDFVRTCSKFRGLQCGTAYAEGFQLAQTWPRLPVKRFLP